MQNVFDVSAKVVKHTSTPCHIQNIKIEFHIFKYPNKYK